MTSPSRSTAPTGETAGIDVPGSPPTGAARVSADAAPDDPPAAPPLSHKRILEIIWALVLCLFVSSLSATVVGTALPTIVGDLGGQDQLAWVASATLLTTTVSTPLWGKLSDLYGRKRLMQLAIAVFVLSSAAAGLAQSMDQLVAARAVQGVGAGGVMALAQAIMADIVSPRERGRYSGYLGASFGIATVAGPLIGGFLVDGPGWRWCFYVGIPVAAVASLVLHRTLQSPPRRRKVQVDWVGAALITTSASALLLLCSLAGQQFPWLSWWTAALTAVTLAGLVLAIVVERRVSDPILPPRLFGNRTFNLTSLAGFFVGVAMFAAMIYLPQYLQVVKGASPAHSGLLTLPLVLSMLIVAIPVGRAISRWGRWKVFPVVGLLFVATGTALLATLDAGTSLTLVCAYMGIFGTGLGFTMQVLVLAVQNTCDRRDLGIATSASFFFRSLGGAVGVSVLGAALVTSLHSAVPRLLAEREVALPAGQSLSDHLGTPHEIAALAEPLRTVIREAFTLGLDRVYLLVLPAVLVALAAVLAVREVPLRDDRARPPAPADGGAADGHSRPSR